MESTDHQPNQAPSWKLLAGTPKTNQYLTHSNLFKGLQINSRRVTMYIEDETKTWNQTQSEWSIKLVVYIYIYYNLIIYIYVCIYDISALFSYISWLYPPVISDFTSQIGISPALRCPIGFFASPSEGWTSYETIISTIQSSNHPTIIIWYNMNIISEICNHPTSWNFRNPNPSPALDPSGKALELRAFITSTLAKGGVTLTTTRNTQSAGQM